MRKVAVITAILEEPELSQQKFNEIVSSYKDIIRGRMGLPIMDVGVSVVAITVVGTIDEVNSLTGKLGRLENISVKTSISKKEIS